jgi:hypothetical protein
MITALSKTGCNEDKQKAEKQPHAKRIGQSQ